MTLSGLALAAAERILQANDGAYPVTVGQVRRTVHACGLRLDDCCADLSYHAGSTVTLRARGDRWRGLAEAIHELAERLVAHPDPHVRHMAAMRVEEHYRATVRHVPEQLLVGMATDNARASVVRCEAPDRFDEEWAAD